MLRKVIMITCSNAKSTPAAPRVHFRGTTNTAGSSAILMRGLSPKKRVYSPIMINSKPQNISESILQRRNNH